MAQIPDTWRRVVGGVGAVELRRYLAVAALADLFREGGLDIAGGSKQTACIGGERQHPALRRVVGLGVANHQRGFVQLGVVCPGSCGEVSLGELDSLARHRGVAAGLEDVDEVRFHAAMLAGEPRAVF